MSDSRAPDQGIRRQPGDADRPVRASDLERENALRALAAHFADGRLDRSEFDERTDTALAARTQSQLHALFADLPEPRPFAVPAAGPAASPGFAANLARLLLPGADLSSHPEPAAEPTTSPDHASTARPSARRRLSTPGPRPPFVLLVPILLMLTVVVTMHGLPPFPLIPLLFILSRRRRWNREVRPWI